MYNIIQKRKIWLAVSGTLMAASIAALIAWGLDFGIDFTGGSLLEIRFFNRRPAISDIQAAIVDIDLGNLVIQPIGEHGTILRFQNIDEEKHQEVLKRISGLEALDTGANMAGDDEMTAAVASGTEGISIGKLEKSGVDKTASGTSAANAWSSKFEELRFDSVGPSIGRELKRKSLTAIFLVLIAIVLYIAWVFRQVSKPVASWKYGIAAIIALFHDVIITLGVFAVLGRFFSIEINTPFVAAILTVLGYSVNDTIVVFDRLRENLPRSEEDFEGTVNISVNQTIARSINTSLTTLLVLLSILFFGGSTIKDFVLALSIGVFIGTYSSIFLASPILVVWERLKR